MHKRMMTLGWTVLGVALLQSPVALAARKGTRPPPAAPAPPAAAPSDTPPAPPADAAPAEAAPQTPVPAAAAPAAPTPPSTPPPAAPAAAAPAAPSAPAAPKPATALDSIALLSINAPDAALSASATAQAAQGLRDLRVFKVLDPETMAGLLGGEMLRQSTGCTDTTCLAELAGAVGATYYVSGSITRVGEQYTINLVLTDQRTAANVDGVLRTAKSLADVGDATRSAAQKVVQKLLANKTGTLRLVVTETNADVKIDDVLVGTTPLSERPLPMGPHKVSVEKEGFLAFRQDLTVNPGEPTVMTGTLVPNQEYINAYKRKNLALRAAAITAGALGLAAFTLAAGAYVGWWALFFTALKDPSAEDVFSPVVSPNRVKSDMQLVQIPLNLLLVVAYVTPLVVPVAAVTAIGLWFFSDDPGRYNAYSN